LIRFVLLVHLAACAAVTGEFICETDDQCRHGDELGFCESTGYCTFTDTSCATQRRYDDNASAAVASACLEGVTTGRIVDRFVVNDEMGRPLLQERVIPAAELKPSVIFEDGSMSPVAYREQDGVFSFANPTGLHYELRYETAGTARAFQHAAPHVVTGHYAAGRRDRVPVTRPTTLSFQQTPALTGQAWITSTGLWTQSAAGNGSNGSVNWMNAGSFSGALGLLDASRFDRVHYVLTGTVLGYSTITAHSSYAVTQIDGVALTAAGPLASVTNRDLCVDVAHLAATELARIKTVYPSATGGSTGWSITAAPARDVRPHFGHSLAFATATTAADGTTAARFVNPYPGTLLVATMTTNATVSIGYRTNGGVTFGVDSRIEVAVDPTDASCSTAAMLQPTTALSGNATIAGTPIDAADKMVTLPAGAPFVIATWTTVRPGPAHVYNVTLHELEDDGAGGTTTAVRGGWQSSEQRVMIPAALLVKGHEYVLQFQTTTGMPNAAAGDHLTVEYPWQVNNSYSLSFVIN
jgi:hypothetical protein